MTGRVRKPKPLTLTQEAEAFGFELDNLLLTEMSQHLTGKTELTRAHELIKRLRDRVVKADGLIDGYALNRARGKSALDAASAALVADSRIRYPKWRRRHP